MPGQAEERPVIRRRDGLQPVERRGQPMPRAARLVRGCSGSSTGSPSLLSSSRIAPAAPGHRCSPAGGSWPAHTRPGSAPSAAVDLRRAARQAACARVASTIVLPVSSIFSAGTPSALKLATARGGRGAVHVGQHAGDAPVDLLGHRAVEGTQASLDMDHRHARVARRLRAGRHSVGVALDNDRGRLLGEHVAELLDHPADLRHAGLPADACERSRACQIPAAAEEDAGQFLVLVLAACGLTWRAAPSMRTIGASFTISGRVPITTASMREAGIPDINAPFRRKIRETLRSLRQSTYAIIRSVDVSEHKAGTGLFLNLAYPRPTGRQTTLVPCLGDLLCSVTAVGSRL